MILLSVFKYSLTTASTAGGGKVTSPYSASDQLGETSGFGHENQCILEYDGHSSLPVREVLAPYLVKGAPRNLSLNQNLALNFRCTILIVRQ